MKKKQYTRAKRNSVLHHFAMDLLGVIADAKRTGQLDATCLETLERVSAGLQFAAVSTPASRETEAQIVCYEAYQVVGSLLDDLGAFDTSRADKILDNLSQCRRVHDDVLPWPSLADETAATAPKDTQ